MTTKELTKFEITIERDGKLIRLVWDEHMQVWAPCICKENN